MHLYVSLDCAVCVGVARGATCDGSDNYGKTESCLL